MKKSKKTSTSKVQAYPEIIFDIFEQNGNRFQGRKPWPEEKAAKTFTVSYVMKKWGRTSEMKKLLKSPDPAYKKINPKFTHAEAIADDLYFWATQDKDYLKD